MLFSYQFLYSNFLIPPLEARIAPSKILNFWVSGEYLGIVWWCQTLSGQCLGWGRGILTNFLYSLFLITPLEAMLAPSKILNFRVSGGCLGSVWEVSGGCLRDSVYFLGCNNVATIEKNSCDIILASHGLFSQWPRQCKHCQRHNGPRV